MEELASSEGDGSGLLLGGAGPAASGAGLLGEELVGLLLRGLFEGTGSKPGSSGSGDLLHGVEIDVQARPLLAKSATDDDFSPLLGQGVDLGQVLVVELARCHIASVIQLAPMPGGALSSLHRMKSTWHCKPVSALAFPP